jgi:ASC-1-like (ASCH) protein
MEHYMTLLDEYFKETNKGKKTIEYRLLDEKRKNISIGDTIIFKRASNKNDFVRCIVTDLKVFTNLLEMYTETFVRDFKSRYKDPQAVVDDTTYYSVEDRLSHPALAIHFKKIE